MTWGTERPRSQCVDILKPDITVTLYNYLRNQEGFVFQAQETLALSETGHRHHSNYVTCYGTSYPCNLNDLWYDGWVIHFEWNNFLHLIPLFPIESRMRFFLNRVCFIFSCVSKSITLETKGQLLSSSFDLSDYRNWVWSLEVVFNPLFKQSMRWTVFDKAIA